MNSPLPDVRRHQLHFLRRGQARFSVASLIGVMACVGALRAEERMPERRPAQREGLQAGMGGGRPGPFLFFDTDRDGALSAGEIAAASDLLRRQDRDGDGRLTGDEMRPRPPRRPRDGGPGPEGEMPPPRPEDERP